MGRYGLTSQWPLLGARCAGVSSASEVRSKCAEERAAYVKRWLVGTFINGRIFFPGKAKGVIDLCSSECICRFQLSNALKCTCAQKRAALGCCSALACLKTFPAGNMPGAGGEHYRFTFFFF